MKKMMIVLMVVLLALVPMMALVAAGPASAAATTVTNEYAPTDDSTVAAAANTTNMGALPRIHIRANSSDNRARGLFQFDLPILPAGATIDSATFSAYYYYFLGADPQGNTYELLDNTEDWSEMSVTWLTRPAVNSVIDSAVVPADFGYVDWDVTTLVQAWYGGTPNFGFTIMDDTEVGVPDSTAQFRSKEYAGTAQDPKLEIAYTYTPTTTVEMGDVELYAFNTTSQWAFVDVTINTSELYGIGSFDLGLIYPTGGIYDADFVSAPQGVAESDKYNMGAYDWTYVVWATGSQIGPGNNIVALTMNVSATGASAGDCIDFDVAAYDMYDGMPYTPKQIVPDAQIAGHVCFYTRMEGDVKYDDSINLQDAQLAAQIYVGIFSPSGQELDAADVNDFDGGTVWNGVETIDIQLIMQYQLGVITVFPGGTYCDD